MHDPMTVAHEIKYPWREYGRAEIEARAQSRQVPVDHPSLDFERTYRAPFITIWHNDPERDGSDDSCGWFMRARHCDQATLKRIEKRFAFEWATGVPHGWFNDDESPNFTAQGIVLDMFTIAANEAFGHWSRKANAYLREHLHQILRFAENPCDSLWTFVHQPYGRDGKREERIREAAACVYSYIMRDSRPWYRHPKWHIRHWSIQCHPLQDLKRWLFSRCITCGRGFKYGESPCAGWNSDGPRWFRSEQVWHSGCDPTRKELAV
jgi:hypothetical protein